MSWKDILKNETSEKLAEQIEGHMSDYLGQKINDEDFTNWQEVRTPEVEGHYVEVILEEMEDPQKNWITARAWDRKGEEVMIVENIRGTVSTFMNKLDDVEIPILMRLLEEVKETFY